MTQLFTETARHHSNSISRANPNWRNDSVYAFYKSNGEVLTLAELVNSLNPQSVLDFGCGNGLALPSIAGVNAKGYDPFVDEFSTWEPAVYDLIVSHFAILHVEDQFFSDTIKMLRNACGKNFVATFALTKHIPHRDTEWYINHLKSHFTIDDHYTSAPIEWTDSNNVTTTKQIVTIWCSV